jgi:hypothetical protein
MAYVYVAFPFPAILLARIEQSAEVFEESVV